MQYRMLGSDGLCVSRLILGSTMFGELRSEDEARALLQLARELGIQTIDTADIYAGGRSEEIIGRLIKGRRHEWVLCTKVGYRVGDSIEQHARASAAAGSRARADQGLSRTHIVSAVEASLRRLQTDYIDLYQIHRWDPAVPIEETLRALEDLIRAGKVRCIGCSNAREEQLDESLKCARRHSLTAFASMQVPYSLLAREAEATQLPACGRAGIGTIAYSVLAGGALAGLEQGRVRPGTVLAQRPQYQARYLTTPNFERLAKLDRVSEDCGRSHSALALGAVFEHPNVTAATVGMQTVAQITDLANVLNDPLPAELSTRLLAIFAA